MKNSCDRFLGNSGKYTQLPNGKIYQLNLDNATFDEQKEAFIKCMTEPVEVE